MLFECTDAQILIVTNHPTLLLAVSSCYELLTSEADAHMLACSALNELGATLGVVNAIALNVCKAGSCQLASGPHASRELNEEMDRVLLI